MKKIFMSGSGGMLGDAFYNIFKQNYNLMCTDKDLNENWLSILDFRNYEEYKKTVENFKPDYLFHIGAYTDLEYCEKNINDTYNTNTISVDHAINISNNLNIPLLYISTAGIFDGKQNIYNDWDTPNPLSVYGKSKFYSEQNIHRLSKKYLILRAGWMMGGGINKDKKFVNKIIKQILNGKKEIYVVDDKMGTPTYTYDFAKNAKLLIENEKYGLFNMVCPGTTSRFEVAKEILKITNLDNKIKINKVNSSYFSKEYFATRPKSENLINLKLQLLSMDIMRDWKICLAEYLKSSFKMIF